jgi:hypothetical protein
MGSKDESNRLRKERKPMTPIVLAKKERKPMSSIVLAKKERKPMLEIKKENGRKRLMHGILNSNFTRKGCNPCLLVIPSFSHSFRRNSENIKKKRFSCATKVFTYIVASMTQKSLKLANHVCDIAH